jgi:hypothetical protein
VTWGEIRIALASAFPDADFSLIDSWIQVAYASILERARWSPLRRDHVLHFPGAYRQGTVSVTNGSATVTGSGTNWSTQTGQKIVIGPDNTSYVVTVIDDSTIELDREYSGETGSGLSYIIFQDSAPLPADAKYARAAWLDKYGLPLRKADEGFPSRAGIRAIIGMPQYWMHGPDSIDAYGNAVRTVVVYPAPENPTDVRVSFDIAAPAFTGLNLDQGPPSWMPGEAIVSMAKVQAYTHYGNQLAAQSSQKIADEMVAAMIRHDVNRSGATPIRVGPTFVSWRRSRYYR